MEKELPNIFGMQQQGQLQPLQENPDAAPKPLNLPNIFQQGEPDDSFAQNVTGTIAGAADFMSGAITGPLSGLAGLSTFAVTGDMERAIGAIEYWSSYTPAELAKKIGVPEQYIYNHAYETIMTVPELVDKGADELGEWARTHSGDNDTYSAVVGAGTKGVATLITYLLGAKGASAGLGKARAAYKDARGKLSDASPERKIYENEKNIEEVSSLVDDAIGRKRPDTEKGPGGTGAVAELRLADDNIPVKTTDGTLKPEETLAGPQLEGVMGFESKGEPTAPIQKQGRAGPDGEVPTLEQGGQADLFAAKRDTPFSRSVLPDEAAARLEEGMPAKGSPDQGVLPFIPELQSKMGIVDDGLSTALGRQESFDFGVDVIFNEGQNAYNKPGFLRTAEDVIATRKFEKNVGRIEEKVNTPESDGTGAVRSGRGFGHSQRGAANFGVAEWIVDKAATVAKRIKAFMNGGKAPEHFYAPREHMSDWEKLSPLEKDVVPDTRPIGDVLEDVEIVKQHSSKAKVIAKAVRLKAKSTGRYFKDITKRGAVFFTESNIRSYYSENPVLKSTIDRLSEINTKWDRINEALRENEVYSGVKSKLGRTAWKIFSPNLKSSLMRQEAGVLGRIDAMKQPDRITLFKAMHHFDNHPDLISSGLMWPTRDMLAKQGLNDTQISIYQHWTKIADNAYDILDYGWRLAKPKSKGVRRIPGYFPHMYRGKYEVRIEDGKGNLVFWTRAESKAMAYKLWEKIQARAAQSADPHMQKVAREGRMLEPEANQNANSVAGLVEAYEKTLRMMDEGHGATKGIAKLFDGIRASLNAGQITHAHNRAGVRGHLTDAFWGDKQFSKESRKSLENYISAVTEFAKKQEIIHKVENPLRAAENKIVNDMKMPNTYEFLRRRIAANKGQPRNITQGFEKSVDSVMESVVDFVTRGNMAPPSVRGQLQFVRNWFTTMKIGFYKPMYLAMNVLQPHFMGLQVMVREKARLGKGNPWLEALKLDINILDFPGVRANAEHRGIALRAMKEKKLNPSLMENTDFMTTNKLTWGEVARRTITGRGIAEHIESVGRLKSLVYAYEVYKSAGMNKEMAYQSATKVVDEIMMNYDRVKRPAAYQDYGLIGEAMSPFATFAHGQMGNALITAKVAMKLAKEGKPLAALEPVVANIGVSMFFAGAMGIIGLAELDLLAKILNAALEVGKAEFRVPEISKTLANTKALSEVVGDDKTIMGISTHDSIRYGVVSAMTRNIPGMESGINMGAGMAAPAANDLLSAPSLGWLKDLFWGDDSAVMSMLRISTGQGSKADWWNVANKTFIPSSVSGTAARAQAVEQGQFNWGTKEDWATKMMPKERDKLLHSVYPNAWNKGQGTVPMSPSDWRVRMWTGAKSLDESLNREIRTQYKTDKFKRQNRVTSIYQRAADALESGKAVPAEVLKQAYEEGITASELIKRARDKAWLRRQGEVEAGIGKKATPANRLKIQKLNEY